MLSYLIVTGAAMVVAALTLYSGFGLGTLMTPIFAIFFPVEVAVASTAVVHFSNNCFKLALVGKEADREIIIRFGVPGMIAAFFGAASLGVLAVTEPIGRYQLGPIDAEVTPVKLAIALLIFLFGLGELTRYLKKLAFDRKYLSLGGLLSGFFGGLSGHQGALRSAFLAKCGLSKEAFVGSNAAIAFLVDLARITTYVVFVVIAGGELAEYPPASLILVATIGAFVGSFFGKKLLHKVTIETVRNITGVMLLVIATGLGLGVI